MSAISQLFDKTLKVGFWDQQEQQDEQQQNQNQQQQYISYNQFYFDQYSKLGFWINYNNKTTITTTKPTTTTTTTFLGCDSIESNLFFLQKEYCCT